MKQAAKLLSLAAVAVSPSVLGSTALAFNARGSGSARPGGGHGSGFSGGYRGGFRGGFSGGFRNGYYGGYHYHYGGWGGWYPSNFAYVYSSPPYYYYYYDYSPPPVYNPPVVVYSSPAVVYGSSPAVVYSSPPPAPEAESSQPPAVDRPLPPTAVHRDTPPVSSRAQQEPPSQYSPQNQSLGVADVKALVKAGLSEEVILNQIRNSRVVYHLTAVEIIDMKESGVSERVINFMINTPPAGSSANDLRFKLTGIMSVPEGGLVAVINGKVVVEKNYVDGAIVKKIGRDQVTLDLNAREVVISLL